MRCIDFSLLLRTVRLCDVHTSGDYKLHLEAGGQKETKTVSVCVVGKTGVLCNFCTKLTFQLYFISCKAYCPLTLFQTHQNSNSGLTTSIIPSPLRLQVLCRRIIPGCLVLCPTTGMLTVRPLYTHTRFDSDFFSSLLFVS